jgi:hypothetical protein
MCGAGRKGEVAKVARGAAGGGTCGVLDGKAVEDIYRGRSLREGR